MPSSRHAPNATVDAARRRLRLRADQALASRLSVGPGERALLEIPTREALVPGDPLQLEVSIGPLVDEVEMSGVVQFMRPAPAGETPTAVVRIEPSHLHRARYLQAVLEGERAASARAHRRVQVDLAVRWRSNGSRHLSRLHDLSRGGAFVVSRTLPPVGTTVELELDGASALTIAGVVTRVREDPRRPGFGMCFKLSDRTCAAALSEVIRAHEPVAAR